MDAFTDPKVTEIVLMASSQIGKTESFIEAGRSRQFVSKCVAQGKIPTNPDETINLAKGKKILAEMKDQGSAKCGSANGNGNGKGKKNSYWDEQSRLTRHKADIAKMESKKLVGKLVTIDKVDSVFGKAVTAVRQRFLGLGSRLAPILTNKSPAFIKREIDAVIYEALNEFGTYIPESGECETSSKKNHKKIKRGKK